MALSSTDGEHSMNDVIYLPTRAGVRAAELFASFDSMISGRQFTFAVHRHLSSPLHLKVSEMSTGKGIAEIKATTTVGIPQPSELVASGRAALSELVLRLGEHIVSNRLDENARAAPVLNGPGYEY